MFNLETLLSINKKRDNSNKKFPNSTNKLVYDRLEIDFDFPDPTILILSDAAKEHLNNMPKFIRDWQAEDMRNANVKDYYKNPVGDAVNVILNIVERIIDFVTYSVTQPLEGVPLPDLEVVVSGLEGVYAAAVNLRGVTCDFLCHTNRLSNVVPVYGKCTDYPCNRMGNTTDPHYLTCSALCRTILYLVHETDGISDARPLLGCFTSLLIYDELIADGVRIILYPEMIQKSLKGFAYETEAGFYSDLLESEKIEIIFNLNEIASSLAERVEHDKRVWRNMKMLNEEQTVFKVMNGMGQTQTMLVRDYIGTEKLKRSLLIDDLPTLKYDVTIDYFGNYIMKPNTEWEMPPDANTPTSIIDDYIDYYTNSNVVIKYPPREDDEDANLFYRLEVFPGALIFNTANGLWSSNQTVTITNTGNTAYTFSNVNFNDFVNTEFVYEFNPANTNIIGAGNSAQFIVAARGIENEDFTEYGIIKIIPSIEIATRVNNTFDDIGVISPLSIINIYGSADEKLILNANNGPYAIVAADAPSYSPYTWINNSEYDATISTIENITDSANLSNMTIQLTYDNQESEDGLIGHWTFDVDDVDLANGEIRDISETGAHGEWFNETVTTAPGWIGDRSLLFNGANDYVTFGTTLGNFGIDDFSVAFWFKTTSNNCTIIGKRAICANDSFWNIGIADGALYAEIDQDEFGTNYILAYTDEIFNTDNWHCIVVVRSGEMLSVYVDGVKLAFDSADEPANISNSADMLMGIGACSEGLDPYAGLIDDLRIYSRALSEEEINRLYMLGSTAHITLNPTDKVLWYASITPHVVSPNNFTYKVTTENGQERLITLGIYGGNGGDNGGDPGDGVDDSALYNETLNTVPDLIIANGESFIINVSNGKPRTVFTYSGPDLSGSAYLDANGNYSLENTDGITSNGYYTYIFTFDGTDRTRTITKAIFT